MRFDPNDYIDVQQRINRFWSENPDGAITTDVVRGVGDFDHVVVLASVFKDRDGDRPDATGLAAEVRGDSPRDGANFTSWHENAETSAIGRALANMGYATSLKDRPSRQEMAKVTRGDDAPQARPDAPGATIPPRAASTTTNTIGSDDVPLEGGGGIVGRQIKAITAIQRSLGLSDDAIKDMHGHGSAKELTSFEASELIARLRQLENRAKGQQPSLIDAAKADRGERYTR